MKSTLIILAAICTFISAKAQLPVMVQNIMPGEGNGYPRNLFVWNGALYFYAADSTHGHELWRYNEAGAASMVADLNPGAPGSLASIYDSRMAVMNSRLYFLADSQNARGTMFSFDGTNGPTQATNFPSGFFFDQRPDLRSVGNKLYFVGFENPLGAFLYGYDGIVAPYKIKVPAGSATNSDPTNLMVYKGKLYFNAAHPSQLYVLDPANDSVSLVTSPAYNTGLNSCWNKTVIGSKMYFISNSDTARQELYSFDGTDIVRLTNLAPGHAPGVMWPIASFNGKVCFPGATNGSDYHLYSLDSLSGAIALTDSISPAFGQMIAYDNKLYIVSETPALGRELWTYDGSTASLVADLNPGSDDGIVGGFTYDHNTFVVFNGHLYFAGYSGKNGIELYTINGPTGVRSIRWDAEVIVHPNPATTSTTLSITLTSAQTLNVVLTDIAGREVYSTVAKSYPSGKHDVLLPLQALPAGQYFYRIIDSGRMLASGRVVKQ